MIQGLGEILSFFRGKALIIIGVIVLGFVVAVGYIIIQVLKHGQ